MGHLNGHANDPKDEPSSRDDAEGTIALSTTEQSSIFNRAGRFGRMVDRALEPGINPLGTVIDELISPVEALIKGRRTILFGTNSYLGLNFHPDCIRAAIEATTKLGTGSTASRVAGGTTPYHLALERDIAALYDRSRAVLFSTGFMANLGLIASLAGRGDAIFLDAHCHASIIDAAKLSNASVTFFAHNDAADLERLFSESSVPPSRTLVVVEGLYSVLGDLGNLQETLPLAKSEGAVTMVDEAHAIGVYGQRGRGAAEHLGVEHLADIISGTFSKSIGVVGGFCVTSVPELRHLDLMARPFLYTASLPPGVVAAARASLNVIATDPSLKQKLWQNAERLRQGLSKAGLTLSGAGPIGSLSLPRKSGYQIWNRLLERGVYVNMLIPPATPNGEIAIRLSVSAAHQDHHIDLAVETFEQTFAEFSAQPPISAVL